MLPVEGGGVEPLESGRTMDGTGRISTLPSIGVAALALAIDWPTQGQLLRFVGRLHPALVHFPIGLVFAAAFLHVLGWRRTAERSRDASFICVCLAAFAAALAAWSGWMNASFETHGRGVQDTILWHRWINVAATAVLFVTMLVGGAQRSSPTDGRRRWYGRTLLASLVLVGIGGHLGGRIVYGEGYLLEVFRHPVADAPAATASGAEAAPDAATAGPTDATTVHGEPAAGTPADASSAPPAVVSPPGPVAFAADVQPILAARCYECHGPSRAKADLRLDRIHTLFEGDRLDWLILPGDPDRSLFYELVTLPAEAEDRMPAKGDPLTPEQIGILRRWIQDGAEYPAPVEPPGNGG